MPWGLTFVELSNRIVLEGSCLIGAFLFVDSWLAMVATDHIPVNRRSGPESKLMERKLHS